MIETKERKKPTIEQKNKVGLVFITKILGLGDEIANKFAEIAKRYKPYALNGGLDQYDLEITHKVGIKLSAIPANIECCDFWQEIENVFPGYNLDYDLPLLRTHGIDRVLEFIFYLMGPWWVIFPDSPILRLLRVTGHAYK